MHITVNGERRDIVDGLTIAQLIVELGIEPSQVAVEQNGHIVPKSTHSSTPVAEGDVIEMVRFIGGG